MLLIWGWGPAFWTARSAKRGTRRPHRMFDGFLGGFENEFGFKPLWVDVEPDDRWQREGSCLLSLVVDRASDCASITTDRCLTPRTQVTRVVRDLFQRTCPGATVRVGPLGLSRRPVEPAELRVLVSCFERVAIEAVHDAVSVRDFEAGLELGDLFWCTASGGEPPVVFAYTEKQAAAIRASGLPERWADLWYTLAKPHDEFGYITRASVEILVDSKQNFEEHYESNWRLYRN